MQDVKDNLITSDDIHLYVFKYFLLPTCLNVFTPSARTEIVALENTLNGTIIPQEEVVAISEYVHSQGMIMHLDGARIWHVAAETNTSLKELCDPFDSVSLCLSKGLGKSLHLSLSNLI